MGDIRTLLKSGAEVVGLKDDIELLENLVHVVTSAGELAKHIEGPTTAEAFLKKFTEDFSGDEVKKAFALAGLSEFYAKLTQLLGKAGVAVGKIPEKYKTLLTPISTFNAADAAEDSGLVEWTILDRTRPIDVGDPDFTLSVGGTARLTFEAGDRVVLPGSDAPKTLLRLDLEAGVNGKGDAKIPLDFLSLSGGVEGALGLDLACYFDTGNSTSLYGLEVARRLPSLPNPFDYQNVWEAFGSTDLNLTALVYTFTESGQVNVEAKLADAFSFDDIGVEVSAAISAEASAQSRFQLILSADGPARADRPINVKLTRGAQTKAGIMAGLTVDVDFSIPAARVHDLLKKAVDKWDGVLGEISPYLSPGTLLQTKFKTALAPKGLIDNAVAQLLGDGDIGTSLRQALEQDIGTAIGVNSADDSALLNLLSARVEEAINKAAGKITGEIGAVRDAALDELARHFPLTGDTAAALRTKLTEKLDPLIAKAKGELIAKIETLLPGNALGDALQKANLWSKKKLETLDQALEPVRQLIERFNKVLHDALDIAGDASRAKVSASLQLESQRTWGETDQIVGTFKAGSEDAAKVFRQLTRGDLPALAAMIQNAKSPTPDFELGGDSSIKKTASVGSKATLAYVLFGFAGSAQTLLSGDATLVLDANGNVQVDDKGSAQKRSTGEGETREVAFVDTHALRRLRRAEGQDADFDLISVSVTITDQDKSMKLEELQKFLRSLEQVKMLRQGTADRATPRFAGWAGSDRADARIPASMAAKLDLSKDQVLRLMRLDARGDDDRLRDDVALEIIDVALRAQRLAGVSEIGRIDDSLDALRGASADYEDLPADERRALLQLARSRRDWQHLLNVPGLRDKVPPLRAQQLRMRGLIELIEGLGEVWGAQPRTPLNPGGWTEMKFASRQAEIAEDAATWLFTNGGLFKVKNAVYPVTGAFLRTLADLAGVPEGSGIAVDFTPKDKDGKVGDTVTLT